MIEVVGDLIDDLVLAGVLGRDDDLCVLLSQLLEHLVHALVEEVIGIGALFRVLSSVDDGPVVLAQDIRRGGRAAGAHLRGLDLVEEAGMAAGVAGGADLDDAGQQGVHVAVAVEGPHILEVAAGLPLDPQGPAAAGIIGHLTGLDGQVVSLLVHVGDHEDLVGRVLLDDDGQQAIGTLLKIGPGEGGLFVLLHGNAVGLQLCAEPVQTVLALKSQAVDPVSGDGRDLLIGQPGRQSFAGGLFHQGDHRDRRCRLCYLFIILSIYCILCIFLVQQDPHGEPGGQLVPLLLQFLRAAIAPRDPVLAEALADLARQQAVALLGQVERRHLAARVDQLLDVLHPADIARADDGDPALLADLPDQVDRGVVFGVAL